MLDDPRNGLPKRAAPDSYGVWLRNDHRIGRVHRNNRLCDVGRINRRNNAFPSPQWKGRNRQFQAGQRLRIVGHELAGPSRRALIDDKGLVPSYKLPLRNTDDLFPIRDRVADRPGMAVMFLEN
jgi:hypothetical protein